MIEATASRFQSVIAEARIEWARTAYLSPGLRFPYNFPSGLQIVPGFAMPLGVGPAVGERGIPLPQL